MDTVGLKDALVTAMLDHAAFDGWSRSALAAAGRDLDLDSDLPARLFPQGGLDALTHFVTLADRMMAADIAAAGPATTGPAGMADQVFQAIRLRLGRWGDHREAVRRATSLLALPGNLPVAMRLTWGTADAIWRAVGDPSHDIAWYTRRATLAAVYSATLLYWLDDSSDGSTETWGFLRRRLDDIRRMPRLRQRLENLAGGGFSVGRAKPPARRWT